MNNYNSLEQKNNIKLIKEENLLFEKIIEDIMIKKSIGRE